MPLHIKPIAEYLTPHKALILEEAKSRVLAPIGDARPLAVKTILSRVAVTELAKALVADVETALCSALETQDMLSGPHDGTTDWVSELQDHVAGALGEAFVSKIANFSGWYGGAQLWQPDRTLSAAIELANAYAQTFQPAPMHAGKFLSSIGIVDSDIQTLEKLPRNTGNAPASTPPAAVAPPPASAAVAPPPVADPWPLVSNAPDAIAVAPPPASAVVPPPQGAPDKDDINKAWQLWYDNGGPGLDLIADKLGVSRGTLYNWCTGKTQSKCTPQQAAVTRADIDRRITGLMSAAAIFGAVK
jgi:hypothetical protein